jgi:DNA-binding transcriptional LysR family regulator
MQTRNFDIEALRALVAIADTASFSQAAVQLGRTQSAVSLQIKRLEAMLGRLLLRRVQGRVDGATDEGLALIGYARQMLRLNDEAYRSVAQQTVAGLLRVGLPEELMESVFPLAMERFQSLYPRVRLSVRSDTSANLLAGLNTADFDLVLFKHCLPEALGEPSLWHEPLVWMAGAAWAHELPSPLPMALFVENCAFRIAASAALARAGVNWQLSYSGSSVTGLRHAVACGLGVTALPRSLLIAGLTIIESGLPVLPQAHISARHASGARHPAADRLVGLLAEAIRQSRAPAG